MCVCVGGTVGFRVGGGGNLRQRRRSRKIRKIAKLLIRVMMKLMVA